MRCISGHLLTVISASRQLAIPIQKLGSLLYVRLRCSTLNPLETLIAIHKLAIGEYVLFVNCGINQGDCQKVLAALAVLVCWH